MQFFDATNTADALMASVGTSTAETVANLTPIVAVIGGIILAFIGIRYIVSLVKSTGRAK
jgi:putative Mn2+ efflux pump MntP